MAGVSKDGQPARPSAAVSPVPARETSETTRSSRRRQVVAATPVESKSAESREAPGSLASTAAGASPEQSSAQGERGSGAGVAAASDAPASGSAERGGEAVHRVEPAYPPAARRRGLEGSVILRVRFDAEGRPEEVVVKNRSGSEMLDGAARDAVKRWRFRGGTAGFVDVPITFRLRGTEPVQVTDAGTGREQ
jgi:protein TonB